MVRLKYTAPRNGCSLGMPSYVVEQIDSQPLWLGEGPHWDAEKKRLYYVDILQSTIHCYNPESKVVSKAVVGKGDEPVSLIIPIENETDKFVISYGTDIATVKWDGVNEATNLEIIASTPNPNTQSLRINDGKCSPRGILFAGTMEINFTEEGSSPGKSALYAFKTRAEAKELIDNVRLSNGLAWSADEKKLYYNDSLVYRVDSFDYDAKNLKLTNRKTVFDFKANQIPGFPDGMTIDVDGNLWVAVYGGSRVLHIDPTTGKLLNTIYLPTQLITSVTFGGPDLNALYVTSASKNEENPKAGCVFKVTGLKTSGAPGNRAKI